MGSTNELFNRLYKGITIIAFSFLLTPIVYAMFFKILGLNAFLAFITTITLLICGYLLQMLFGKITKIKRKPHDLSYESSTKFFTIKDCALPVTICVVISIVFFNIVVGYMKYRFETGIDPMYDRDSLYPYIAMLIVAAVMTTGVVLWFYPYSRIISLRSSFVYFVLFIIIFIFTSAYSAQWISAVCLFGFLLCALVILNQSHIIRTIILTKIGVPTARVRLYNMGIVLLFIGVVLGMLLVVLSIVVGLSIVGNFLLVTLLASILGIGNLNIGKEFTESVGDAALGVSLLGLDGNSVTIHALWYLFILIVVVTIISLIFIRSIRKVFKSISDFFGALINNIISLFTDTFFFFTFKDGNDGVDDYINYKDEELDVDKISAKLKMQEFNNKRYTYKDYINKLNSLKTVDEKYIFAYQSLVKCWNGMDFSLRKSDTPRQIKDKINARTTIKDISVITETFETIHYGDSINNDVNISQKISSMNYLIRKYYD